MIAANTIMFAIQAGVRLYGAGRRAYIADTRQRGLILPLIRGPELTILDAVSWYVDRIVDGGKFLDRPENAELKRLTDAFLEDAGNDEDKRRRNEAILDRYAIDYAIENPTLFRADGTGNQIADGVGLSSAELAASMRVRQWADSDAPTSPIRIVAGTLVNTAVDYFVLTPGAVSLKRPEGRALSSFLHAIDDIDFVDTPNADIAGSLLVSTLRTVAEHPTLIATGPKERLLIGNVAQSLASATSRHLKDRPLTEVQEAGEWLQLAAHAVLKAGAETVLANPELYVGLDDQAQRNAVVDVGSAIADLLIGPDKLRFQPLFSAPGLDTVAKAALGAVAKNPSLLRFGDEGLKNIVVEVAGTLATGEKILQPGTGPELVRLILEKSADNMDLIWGGDFRDGSRHLLVVASRTLVTELAREPAGAEGWRPLLTQKQILGMTETVLAEVVDNPAWLGLRPGEQSTELQAAIDAVLASLRGNRGNMLNAESGVAAIRAGIKAAAVNARVLARLPGPAGQPGKRALTHAIDAVFDTIDDDGLAAGRKWQLARQSVITGLIETAMAKLADNGSEEKHVAALKGALEELAAGNIELPEFEARLDRALREA